MIDIYTVNMKLTSIINSTLVKTSNCLWKFDSFKNALIQTYMYRNFRCASFV